SEPMPLDHGIVLFTAPEGSSMISIPFPSFSRIRPSEDNATAVPPLKAWTFSRVSRFQTSTIPGVLPTARSLPSALKDRDDTSIMLVPALTLNDPLGPRMVRGFCGCRPLSCKMKFGFGKPEAASCSRAPQLCPTTAVEIATTNDPRQKVDLILRMVIIAYPKKGQIYLTGSW